MKLKSFFTSPLEKTIHDARLAPVPQAVVLAPPPALAESPRRSVDAVFSAVLPLLHPQDLKDEIAILRDQIDGLRRELESSAEQTVSGPALAAQAWRELVSAGLDSSIATAITEKTSGLWQSLTRDGRSSGASAFRGILVECILSELSFAPAERYSQRDSRAVLVFTGPPGAGKTTTLTKIAVQEFLSKGVPVRILSFDPHHAAAHEKLRSLARLIGAAFVAAHTLREFDEAVADSQVRGALLIDTPGYAPSEFEAAQETARSLSRVSPRETHLVLPAWMAKSELLRQARCYQDFGPDFILFSKLDETESYGPVISAAIELRKPLSFFAGGQRIPEDITLASPDALFDSLFYGRRVEEIWAA